MTIKDKWYTATDTEYTPYFTYDYDSSGWVPGHWILIRHVRPKAECRKEKEISRPILALFVGFSLWDHALVVNFVRTNYELQGDPKIERIALWSDNILVLGHWNHKPTLSEVKAILGKENAT